MGALNLRAGDHVVYRGGVCSVTEVIEVPAPSGALIKTILIDQPGARQRWVLASEVVPLPRPPLDPDDELPW